MRHVLIYSISVLSSATVWQVSIDGGEPKQLTDFWSESPFISPDGKWIAFGHYNEQVKVKWQSAITPITGGALFKTFDVGFAGWLPDSKAFSFVKGSSVWNQPIDGGPPVKVTDFKSGQIHKLAWSPEGKYLVISRGEGKYDAVMIKDFR